MLPKRTWKNGWTMLVNQRIQGMHQIILPRVPALTYEAKKTLLTSGLLYPRTQMCKMVLRRWVPLMRALWSAPTTSPQLSRGCWLGGKLLSQLREKLHQSTTLRCPISLRRARQIPQRRIAWARLHPKRGRSCQAKGRRRRGIMLDLLCSTEVVGQQVAGGLFLRMAKSPNKQTRKFPRQLAFREFSGRTKGWKMVSRKSWHMCLLDRPSRQHALDL